MEKRNQMLVVLFFFIRFVFAQGEFRLINTKSFNSIHWGVNIHDGGDDPSNVANVISIRNLKCVRMDLEVNKPDDLAKFTNAARILKAKGIKVTAILISEFGHGRSRNSDYDANLDEVERVAYEDAKPQILKTKDYVTEYELQNEVPLYSDIKTPESTGQYPADFNTPAGKLQAAALRGLAKAVDDVRKSYKLPIRIILGTVDRRFGFLTFMQQQDVIFDIIGYHVYPWKKNAPLDKDSWFGEDGALGQLSKFNKPIHINEFNCGEIYQGDPKYPGRNYENQAGQPVTEMGLKSLNNHLITIVNQNVANIEAVFFYEISDEPHKEVPENRFGLYFDEKLKKPKVSLYIATAFAGGKLSKKEKNMLIKRGLYFPQKNL